MCRLGLPSLPPCGPRGPAALRFLALGTGSVLHLDRGCEGLGEAGMGIVCLSPG